MARKEYRKRWCDVIQKNMIVADVREKAGVTE